MEMCINPVAGPVPMQAIAIENIGPDGVARCRLFFSDREVEHFPGLLGRICFAAAGFTLAGLRQREDGPPEVDMGRHLHRISSEHLQVIAGEVEVADLGHRLHAGDHISFPAGQMHHLIVRRWAGECACFTSTWRPALKECSAVADQSWCPVG